MIPPFIQQIIGVLVRALVVALAGYLAGHAGITLSESQIGSIVAYLVPIAAVLAWSLWQKYFGRQKLLQAVAQANTTEAAIEANVKSAVVSTPSVLTPKTERP